MECFFSEVAVFQIYYREAGCPAYYFIFSGALHTFGGLLSAPHLFLFCPVAWEPTFSVQFAVKFKMKFAEFCCFFSFLYQRKVFGASVSFLKISLILYLVSQWWYSQAKLSSILKFVKASFFKIVNELMVFSSSRSTLFTCFIG